MSVGKHFNTNSYRPKVFLPHGTIESRVEGNLFIQEATGPFNEEILLAMAAVHIEARALLLRNGSWGALFVFKNSALASIDMLCGFQNYLAAQVALKQSSTATALVLSPDVEGASLMTEHYLKVWRGAGIACECFQNIEQARNWLDRQMQPVLTSNATTKTVDSCN